jgi:hypothetical protein
MPFFIAGRKLTVVRCAAAGATFSGSAVGVATGVFLGGQSENQR